VAKFNSSAIGYGAQIPPLLDHVIIYFLQKKESKDSAIDFFNYYEGKKWKNRRGNEIRDWKVHAWNWIWNKE